MYSAMLLLSLDPKGNLMNNEQSSERGLVVGGWGEQDEEMGRTRVRERGPSGPGHDGEMEGGQLVSVHPSIRPQRRHEENGGRCVMDEVGEVGGEEERELEVYKLKCAC